MRVAVFALIPAAFGRLLTRDEPGITDEQVYKSAADACSACKAHEGFLDSPKYIKQKSAACECQAIDINGVFADDSTYAATARTGSTKGSGKGSKHSGGSYSENVGDKRLPFNFKWHCNAIHDAGKNAEYEKCA